MSRQSRIMESLAQLKKLGAIQEFHQEYSKAEPNRRRWFVQSAGVSLYTYTTGEVEAFITGAESALCQVTPPIHAESAATR